MIAVILCAGFATRMHPLTQNFPKPLLDVAGRPVIDYLMDQIVELPRIEVIHIVSNARFFDHFSRWRSRREKSGAFAAAAVHLHNDGATDNDNRLGAAADLRFVLNTLDRPGRMLVAAGDNIFRFSLKPLWQKFLNSRRHHILALPETDRHRLQATGVLELGEKDRVLRLHEKPSLPPSTWICPPLYFFQPSLRHQIESFLSTPGNHDAPGYFIDYLCQREPVEAFRLQAGRLDIGSIASYRAADRELRQNPVYTDTARG